jgi:IS605 OrfB family transposase
MKTISFRFKYEDKKLQDVLLEDSRICSAMKRFVFNRLKENKTKVEINSELKEKFKCNSFLRSSEIIDGSMAFDSTKKRKWDKLYFGKFKKFQKGLITKEEYIDSRNTGIYAVGEANQKGNRLFKVDVQNGKIIYKRACKEHYDLIIDQKISDKQRWLLNKIQILMGEKKTPVTVRVKNDIIYLTYDEKVVEKEKQFKNLMNNRVLGIDLNPNYFGISIIEFKEDDSFKVLYKEAIDVSKLQTASTNKIDFELHQINHHILRLCKNFKASKLSVEDLKFKKNKFWNKNLNRLCKNQFRYSMVKSHLSTLCSTYGVEFIEVNSAYSSIIGNFVHGSDNCPDMVSASIEIARRAYKKFEKGWFQPSFVSNERLKQVLGNQWKEELGSGYQSWKGLSGEIKELKLKYRFPLLPNHAVFSKFHNKRLTSAYRY